MRPLPTICSAEITCRPTGWRLAGACHLQVVPVISGITGRPGQDAVFQLFGSGFHRRGKYIKVGGVTLTDTTTSSAGGDVVGNNTQYNDLAVALSVEGPIRITTDGGFFEIAGPVNATPAFIELSAITASAALGQPANGTQASANTGQSIVLVGQGFTNSTQVQFAGGSMIPGRWV